MQIMVKATFTIIDDDAKAKRTEVIEMVYPMDENRNFLKSFPIKDHRVLLVTLRLLKEHGSNIKKKQEIN